MLTNTAHHPLFDCGTDIGKDGRSLRGRESLEGYDKVCLSVFAISPHPRCDQFMRIFLCVCVGMRDVYVARWCVDDISEPAASLLVIAQLVPLPPTGAQATGVMAMNSQQMNRASSATTRNYQCVTSTAGPQTPSSPMLRLPRGGIHEPSGDDEEAEGVVGHQSPNKESPSRSSKPGRSGGGGGGGKSRDVLLRILPAGKSVSIREVVPPPCSSPSSGTQKSSVRSAPTNGTSSKSWPPPSSRMAEGMDVDK